MLSKSMRCTHTTRDRQPSAAKRVKMKPLKTFSLRRREHAQKVKGVIVDHHVRVDSAARVDNHVRVDSAARVDSHVRVDKRHVKVHHAVKAHHAVRVQEKRRKRPLQQTSD
jgi:hypothetical protein